MDVIFALAVNVLVIGGFLWGLNMLDQIRIRQREGQAAMQAIEAKLDRLLAIAESGLDATSRADASSCDVPSSRRV